MARSRSTLEGPRQPDAGTDGRTGIARLVLAPRPPSPANDNRLPLRLRLIRIALLAALVAAGALIFA